MFDYFSVDVCFMQIFYQEAKIMTILWLTEFWDLQV